MIDEHIAVMEALKGVQVDGAVLVTTPQVQQEQKNIGNKKKEKQYRQIKKDFLNILHFCAKNSLRLSN